MLRGGQAVNDFEGRKLAGLFDRVIGDSAARIRALGFKRSGRILRLVRDGNAAVVEFQKSTSSPPGELRFTINLAVICGELLDDGRAGISKASSLDGHLVRRIGWLMSHPSDHWWTISCETVIDDLAREVSSLVLETAVPYLTQYLNTNQLMSLWRSGQSPGLTDVQRMRFLGRLSG